jgi:hypothetical protein
MKYILSIVMVFTLSTDCHAVSNDRDNGKKLNKFISFINPDFHARLHTKEFGTLEFNSRKDFLNSYHGTPHNLFGPALEVVIGKFRTVEYWYEGRLHHPFGPSVIVYDIKEGKIVFTSYHHQGIFKRGRK